MGNQIKRAVRTPKGDFPSIKTAAEANGHSNYYVIQKARAGESGWRYLSEASSRTVETEPRSARAAPPRSR